jgi:hypothetical protein
MNKERKKRKERRGKIEKVIKYGVLAYIDVY